LKSKKEVKSREVLLRRQQQEEMKVQQEKDRMLKHQMEKEARLKMEKEKMIQYEMEKERQKQLVEENRLKMVKMKQLQDEQKMVDIHNQRVSAYHDDVLKCQKRLKGLKKKHRDIVELQEKIATMMIVDNKYKVTKDQQLKLDRLNALMIDMNANEEELKVLIASSPGDIKPNVIITTKDKDDDHTVPLVAVTISSDTTVHTNDRDATVTLNNETHHPSIDKMSAVMLDAIGVTMDSSYTADHYTTTTNGNNKNSNANNDNSANSVKGDDTRTHVRDDVVMAVSVVSGGVGGSTRSASIDIVSVPLYETNHLYSSNGDNTSSSNNNNNNNNSSSSSDKKIEEGDMNLHDITTTTTVDSTTTASIKTRHINNTTITETTNYMSSINNNNDDNRMNCVDISDDKKDGKPTAVRYADIIGKATTPTSGTTRPQILLRPKNTTTTTTASVNNDINNADRGGNGGSSSTVTNPPLTAAGGMMTLSSSNLSTGRTSLPPDVMTTRSITPSSSSTTTSTSPASHSSEYVNTMGDTTATSTSSTATIKKGPVSWSGLLNKTARPNNNNNMVVPDSSSIPDRSFDNDLFPPLQVKCPSTTTTTTTSAMPWKRASSTAVAGSNASSQSSTTITISTSSTRTVPSSGVRNDGWAIAPTAKKTMNKW